MEDNNNNNNVADPTTDPQAAEDFVEQDIDLDAKVRITADAVFAAPTTHDLKIGDVQIMGLQSLQQRRNNSFQLSISKIPGQQNNL